MKKYGIAERFTSLQGEGLYTGTMMHFVRFSGCSVGKSDKPPQHLAISEHDPLNIYRETCTTYDGRKFLCDTDFRTKEALSVDEIIAGIPDGVDRVCLTGGEPLDRDLTPLLNDLAMHPSRNLYVHIETSGTKSILKAFPEYSEMDQRHHDGGWLWITVSPKFGCLPSMIECADEIKILVDKDFDIKKLPTSLMKHPLVWLQPVNEEFDVHDPNVQKCLGLIREYPSFRLSMQMHKIWRVR